MSKGSLVLDALQVKLGGFKLHDISLSVEPGEILVILGPNGAGKSVLLETIAGFHRLHQGEIRLGDLNLAQLAPEQRHIGFVFQSYALFPHLDVLQNIRFALPDSERSRKQGVDKANLLLERFALTSLAKRRPQDLSGGEKQRVALARAMATEPSLFLFDEPFAAMDAQIRLNLGEEIRLMLKDAGVPAIFVTHDQLEAQVLADRLGVLHNGSLIQSGNVTEVFSRPANAFIASFVGMENIYEGTVHQILPDGAIIKTGDCHLLIKQQNFSFLLGESVNIAIRPEDITLGACSNSGHHMSNEWEATIRSVTPFGPLHKVRLEAGLSICAYVFKQGENGMNLIPGARVKIRLPAEFLHVLK
ncbi:MAG TPA: ABC transporter ATP-binding protein [Burkholderiales bacterium]|nr:ABC transporter ATP-binding protein [Burkholderiales bacterium]